MADRYVPRKLVCIAGGYMTGLLIAAGGMPLWAIIPMSLCAAASAVYSVKKHSARIRAVAVVILCAAVGMCVYPHQDTVTGDISVQGTVTLADTEGRPFYIIRADDGTRTGVYTEEKDLIRGDRIAVSGTGTAPKSSSMRSRGVYTVIYSPEIKVISHSGGILKAAADIRKAAVSRIRSL
ncbi:MAG: hypothetical protein ILP19_09745, partial [Oscillospiraceae bacterium]|nr:hypothetical protein [Oscillospiraceae bacterium]